MTGQEEEIATGLVYDMRFRVICDEERQEPQRLYWWDNLAASQGRTVEDLDLEDSIIDSVHDAFHEAGIENPDVDDVAQAVADIMGSLGGEDDEKEGEGTA
jgi:hypothetical protein